jgi:hypothetical protein
MAGSTAPTGATMATESEWKCSTPFSDCMSFIVLMVICKNWDLDFIEQAACEDTQFFPAATVTASLIADGITLTAQ